MSVTLAEPRIYTSCHRKQLSLACAFVSILCPNSGNTHLCLSLSKGPPDSPGSELALPWSSISPLGTEADRASQGIRSKCGDPELLSSNGKASICHLLGVPLASPDLPAGDRPAGWGLKNGNAGTEGSTGEGCENFG